ncbi:hypothetical protein AXE80_10845 [Wenyingzhuangia fucanilytica]|uniref:Uncharacterized protein n=1 Tax=Wenyingzhuangia fucanilytica TaxID=1790137 RepID=A0A1B1Y7I0_9FLAO|nr:hypothetical protein [Wenyingzhuangia fucanilytica]ANW96741.1 hypothetical protein AXE80_10845 [Wenyingzhuangia fucanilytica]
MRKDSKLEGLHHEILMDWITSEKTESLDPEMVEYLTQLDKCRGWHYSLKNENYIIKALMAEYPKLTRTAAKTRYVNAMNYFYADTEIKQEAYINMYAQDLDRIKELIILTAKAPEQAVLAVKPIKEAVLLRGLLKDKKEALPAHLFEPQQPIIVMDSNLLSIPKVDRNVLAAQIDSFQNVSVKDKDRLKRESGYTPFEVEKAIETDE